MLVECNRISKKSLLALLLAGVGLGSFFVFLLLVVIGLFVSGSVTLSGEIMAELPGPIEALLLWPIFALVWTLITWLFSILGLWTIGKLFPLKFEFRDSLSNDKIQEHETALP